MLMGALKFRQLTLDVGGAHPYSHDTLTVTETYSIFNKWHGPHPNF